jgi:DNA-binding protein HU-beta
VTADARHTPRDATTKLKGDSMNKAELVEAIAKKTSGTKASVEATLDALMETITASLAKGDAVALIGFGTFTVAKRAARKGRNPSTGAEIKIPAAKVAKFSAGANLKKAVNKK